MRLIAPLLAIALGAAGGASALAASSDGLAPPQAPPPARAQSLGVEWRSLQTPSGTVLMAVARPSGDGPFPAVAIFHGSHGFARDYVQLAKELAQHGVVAVAACWFAPGEGRGMRDISPLPCPDQAPRISGHQSKEAVRTVHSIVVAVRGLPDVIADRIAIFGHSRGGGAVWNYVLQGGKPQAVILNSTGYPDELVNHAARFPAPVLILHGENDTVGPMTHVQRAQLFEEALRRAGKPVEAVYYQGGEHNSLFTDPSQRTDEVRRMQEFLRERLQKN